MYITHSCAYVYIVKAREAVEKVYPHIASVDVDLELDDTVHQQNVGTDPSVPASSDTNR